MAAGFAHEINTPTQDTADNVRFLETACQDLISLASQTLQALGGAEEGTPIDIAALRKPTGDADLEFLVEEVPKAIEPSIHCFGADLSQVILNLIVNASHALESRQAAEGSHSKGKKLLKVATLEQHVEIRISDSGTGISEDHRKRNFDLFFTTKEVGKGTGQGLVIAHAIVVDKHGRTISVESVVGQGTVLILQIPTGAEPSADAA